MAASRPFNAAVALLFAVLAAAGFWKMRVEPVLHQVLAEFEENVFVKRQHPDGSPLKTEYTGLAPVDGFLYVAVATFVPGCANWEPEIRLQQIYFLHHYFAICCIRMVEAYRPRNAWRIFSFAAVFGALEQVIGGATMIPLYYLTYVLASSSDKYFTSGRQVPLAVAKCLAPALIVGYLIPTILMFYPWGKLATIENFVALWLPSPMFPSCLLVLPSIGFLRSAASTPKSADVRYLKALYLVAGLACTISHVYVLYASMTSADPRVSLASVMLPTKATWKTDAAHGLHWMFQWDFWVCFGVSYIWCLLGVVDIWRIAQEQISVTRILAATALIGAAALIGGPGTAMAALWYWREGRMAKLDEGSSRNVPKAKLG